MIKREQYLKEIRPLIGKDIIKVLTGIRRCGKSTLLKQIKEELIQMGISEKNILEINFDSMHFQDIVDKDDLNNMFPILLKIPMKNIICSLMKFKMSTDGKEAYQVSL